VGSPNRGTGSTAADARAANLILVLQTLYRNPGLTRAEVARRTGLTRVTISELVALLIDDGLIHETGIAEQARPGKKAISLEVRDDTTDIIACDLSGAERLRGGVYTLHGEQRRSATRPVNGARGEAAIDLVTDLIADLMTNPDKEERQLLGIGIGVPGTINSDGRVLTAMSLGWSDLDLQGRLHERFGVPVNVINDANAGVLAEQTFSEGHSSLLRIQIARGVGAGLLLDGQMVIGQSSAAGEIGHVIVQPDGELCPCGQRGCLETWASVPALETRIQREPERRDAILAEGGRYLGAVLVPILALLDINDVVLGGESRLLDGPYSEAACQWVDSHLPGEIRRPVRVRTSSLGDAATLLGAVAVVLRTSLGLR
jgi:predicted NBD/HSP70 family sugar kinase